MKSVTEFTSEANPDELSAAKLQVLFDGGVNRLSMGFNLLTKDCYRRLGARIAMIMSMKQSPWLEKLASIISALI